MPASEDRPDLDALRDAVLAAGPLSVPRPPIEVHPLAGFSVRELLEAVRARAIVVGGYDGRLLADTIGAWVDPTAPSTGLMAYVLDMRAVDMSEVPMPSWQTRQVAAYAGFYTAGSCTLDCRHATPGDALRCTAKADS